MSANDIILLTQKLVGFNTINPPGNEAVAEKFIGKLEQAMEIYKNIILKDGNNNG